ncbi:UNVERIFIED_CONTAM: E3 ubiquitin protein ligase DRIP2 [Sesamum calycinum]|uniref:E3 ubiquitin protein ligase DRIP2 n=1 Tax=Sesamum calycinum TaxID=2727403 RepID=A0AAW2SBC3_9LAMI
MTGRRSKSIARKASKGSSFTIEKPVKKEDDSLEDHPESSSSPETLNKFTQSTRQNSAASEPSNHPSPDKGRENGSEAWEGKVDLWKPLNCLVEAANRSKSSKFSIQGSIGKSEALHSHDSEGFLNKTKSKDRQKSKVQDEKNCSDDTPPESERPKKLRRVRQRRHGILENLGFLLKSCSMLPILNLTAKITQFGSHWEGDAQPLPQIAASYLRIKDGSIPVSFIQKYLKMKLDLASEDEVEIKCMGQAVIPTLTLNNLVDLWLHTTTTDRVSATIGSSAKDFVMVLGYARKIPDS